MFDSQRCPTFWFFNPFGYLTVQFSSCLLAGSTCIHSYPIMFLLFFSLILSLIPVLKPLFLIHVLVSFCFSTGCTGILSPYLFIFNSQWNECYPFQNKETWLFELGSSCKLLFYAYICDIAFCSCFYPWLYILNIISLTSNLINVFLVSPSTYSIIYSEKMPSIRENFNHVFEVFQGLFLAFLLQ